MAPRVLNACTISSVKRLLKQGFTHAHIAEKFGIARSTVMNIHKGRVADHHPRRSKPKNLKIGICPEHGRVTLPCIGCAAIAYRRRHPEKNWLACDPPVSLRDDRAENEITEIYRQIIESDDRLGEAFE